MDTRFAPPLWAAEVDEWVSAIRASGRAETTVRARREHVLHVARRMRGGPWEVTAEQLRVWFMAQQWAAETYRTRRTSLILFYRWGIVGGRSTANPAEAVPVMRPARPRPMPLPPIIYHEGLARGTSRERLILRLAVEAGLRRAEIAQVHRRDVLPDLGGWSLVVHGKGAKERIVPLPDDIAADLLKCDGWALPGSDGGHLSPRWVGKLISRLLPGDWTLHKGRHAYAAATWAASGRNVYVVQELLGHTSADTTRVYIPIERTDLRSAVIGAQRQLTRPV